MKICDQNQMDTKMFLLQFLLQLLLFLVPRVRVIASRQHNRDRDTDKDGVHTSQRYQVSQWQSNSSFVTFVTFTIVCAHEKCMTEH